VGHKVTGTIPKSFVRAVVCVAAAVSVLSLAGCSSAKKEVVADQAFETVDTEDGLTLATLENDLYVAHKKSGAKKRLTYTPDTPKVGYLTSNDSKVIYYEKSPLGTMSEKYYLLSIDENDRTRQEISWERFKELYSRR